MSAPRRRSRAWLPIVACLAILAPGAAPVAASASCTRFASPSGSDAAAGTEGAPLRSAQKLVASLRPGETGCLRAGTYTPADFTAAGGYVLLPPTSGQPGAPITLQSHPGERATLKGPVKFADDRSHVTLRDLDIDVTGTTTAVGILLFGDHIVLEDNDIGSSSTRHCMQLGSVGNGTAIAPIVRRNRIHDCGRPDNDQDHAIYAAVVRDAQVVENTIWNTGGYALHLYPDADRTLVARNVIDDSDFGGVIVASDQYATQLRSDDNVVERNVITNGARYGVTAWWGPAGVGSGNVVRGNCLWNNRSGNLGYTKALTVEGNVVADPRYADAGAHDYRMAEGSPCAAAAAGSPVSAGPSPAAPAAPSEPAGSGSGTIAPTPGDGSTPTAEPSEDTTGSRPAKRPSPKRRVRLAVRRVRGRSARVNWLLVRGRAVQGTRTVKLQVRSGRRWKALWRGRPSRTGAFRARVKLRVPANRRRLLVRAVTPVGASARLRVRV